jgi:tyrosinase
MSIVAASSPTWYGDIQKMFAQHDIDCMQSNFGTAFNLGSYQFVATHTNQIDQVVSSGYMPKGGPAWSEAMVTTFRDWIKDGCLEGTPPATQATVASATPVVTGTGTGPRLRKDIRSLLPDEISTLAKAFQGIMDLDTSNPNSYFQLAGIHWLPAPDFYCMHHDPGFLPWHRPYQILFENALRTIPGCENVTMPYWDITMTEPLPDWLYAAPFASYTFPQDVGPAPYTKGYTTERYPAATILSNLQEGGFSADTDVFADVSRAMAQTTWEGFNGFFANADYDTLIAGHDNGHNSTGTTMADQSVAAFDPIFWFFHGNWDRVFWEWQKQYNATTQAGMLSRISGDQASHDTFTDPVVAQLSPFTAMDAKWNAIDLLNLSDWGIDYAPPSTVLAPQSTVQATQAAVAGHKTLHAAEGFRLDSQMVHVRVEGVNRLRIPGSFRVSLMGDGKVLGSRTFFQPSNSQQCPNCIKNGIAHFDFKLPLAAVAGGLLKLSIELVNGGKSIPLASLGNPTIEVRIPLHK